MARRRLLSDEQLAPFWAWASDERVIVRHYTLSRGDLDLIAKKRTASNQLGFAVLMCGMRFPGRVLDVTETLPAAVLAFIADQVGVPPAQFATYRQRPTNRREHVAELMAILSCRAFDSDAYPELLARAVSLAQGTPRAERLVQSVIDEARSRRILLPTRRAIDLLCHRARARSESLLQRALTTGLTNETKNSLDALLKIAPEMTSTRLTWLRNASQSPAPTNILGLIERVEFLRKLDRPRATASHPGQRVRSHRARGSKDIRPAFCRGGSAAPARVADGGRFVAGEWADRRNAPDVRQADGQPVPQGRAAQSGEGGQIRP
jgi:hypothetical protein